MPFPAPHNPTALPRAAKAPPESTPHSAHHGEHPQAGVLRRRASPRGPRWQRAASLLADSPTRPRLPPPPSDPSPADRGDFGLTTGHAAPESVRPRTPGPGTWVRAAPAAGSAAAPSPCPPPLRTHRAKSHRAGSAAVSLAPAAPPARSNGLERHRTSDNFTATYTNVSRETFSFGFFVAPCRRLSPPRHGRCGPGSGTGRWSRRRWG